MLTFFADKMWLTFFQQEYQKNVFIETAKTVKLAHQANDALNNWAQIVLISVFLLFQLHDKDMRIRQERSEKERMKDYFNQCLELTMPTGKWIG